MKQSITRSLFVSVLLVFALTTAWAQKSVLDESFTGGALPSSWSSAFSTYTYWQFGDGNANFSALVEDAVDTLFTPMKSLSTLKNKPSVAITYLNKANLGQVNDLKVLYRASANAEWQVLKSFADASDGQQYAKEELPAGLKNVQIALAGAYKGGAETRVYRLAVENKTEATDAPTGLKTEDLTTTGVTLWWDPCMSNMFQQYNVKVNSSQMTDKDADGDVANYVNMSLTDEFLELNGLTPNKEYWFYVQYDCGDGDVSPWAESSFRTHCDPISGTFAEDFEGEISTCYTIVEGEGSSTEAGVSGEYAYKSLKSFKSNSGKGKYNYFILPEFNSDVKSYQVSFMAAAEESGNTYTRTVTIGVCTTPDAESFTEVKTLNLPKGRTWEQIVVALKGYTGAGKYIAFRFGNEEKENRLFIDNIQIQKAQSCPKPMFVEVSDIASNSAKLKWVETGNATEWNLVLSTKSLADPEDFEPNESKGEFVGPISTNPYTATNLRANTTYYVYLLPGCGKSEWTNEVVFKTNRAVSFPYSEHFDRMDSEDYTDNTDAVPNGWVMDTRGNNPQYTNYYDKQYMLSGEVQSTYNPYVTTKQNHEATAYVNASLLLRGTNISSTTPETSTGFTSIAMLPAMPKEVNTMMVTFWASSAYAQTVKIGVANTQANNELKQGEQLGENITEVGEAAITGGNEWNQYKVLLTDYKGTGRYITFYLKPGTSTPSVYIDDIEIDDAPNCNEVSTLSAEATGTDKATITWTDASSNNSWTIKVSTTAIEPATQNGDKIAAQTVSSKSYNLTGLTMGGTYYIYVSPTCGADDSNLWKSTTVTTLVGLQVPYYNDFTNEPTGANASRGPKNWKLGLTYTDTPGATSSNWPHVNTTVWTNPPVDVVKNCVYFNNTTTVSAQFPYAIMPELLNGNVKDMKIGFYAYWNNAEPSGTSAANYAYEKDKYYGVLKIGVVSSPSEINKDDKFKKVTQVAAVRCKKPKAAEYFVVDMSKYTGSGKYIVFYQDTAKYNYMMIDNLYVGSKSDPVPAAPIVNLKYTSLTTTGATLTWTEAAEATKWNVRVFTEAQEDPDAGEPVFSTTVNNTPSVTITGLLHSSQYYAYVQSSQSNGNGAWVSLMFWTDCEKAPLPFTEDFNSYGHGSTSLNTLSWCYMVGDKYGGQPGSTYTGTTPYYYNYVMTGQRTTSATTAWGPGTSYYYVDHTYGNDPTTNIFYMYAAKDKLAYLVLPELDGDLATMTMRFYGCYSTAFTAGGSSVGAVEVCIYNESDGSFTHVENFKLSKAKDWEEFNVNFPSDIHSGRIAFRINNTEAWRSEIGSTYASGSSRATFYMYLDDIKVQLIPQCQKILDIEVEDIDSVSAKISWAASEASQWNLKVSSVELADPDAATADVFDGATTTNSKTLTGLDDNTWHYVYVQTVRPEKSCVGEWSLVKKFRTLCKKLSFPYVESFDPEYYTTTGAGIIPDCSTLSGQDADHSYITTRGTGNLALYLKQVTKDHNNYFAFPALNVDSVKRLQLSMKVAPGSTTATNYYYYEVGVMTDPNDPGTFVAIAYDSVQGATGYPFSDKVYTFEKYAGDEQGKFGTYIALKPLQYQNPTTVQGDPTKYYAGYVYIDDVTIDFIETCAKPTELQADSIGTYGAKFSWKTDDKTAAHRVRIFNSADADPDSDAFVAEAVVNDEVATIEGLQSLTTYYAFVRKECGATDGNSKWSSAYMFRTECAEYQSLPYEEGFEAFEANAIPDCWTPLDNTTNGKSRVGGTSTYAITGSRYLNVNYGSVGSSSGNTYYKSSIVTPQFDVTNIAELVLCLDARTGANTGSLKIEAVSDNTTNADAIVLTTISDITTTPKKVYLKLADYYTSAQPYKYLRFSPETQGVSIYVDNMLFTKDLNLVLPVEKLKAQAVTESSIKFSFVEPTPGINQWQVAYVAEGGDIADATVKTIDATEYTIEGLAANTGYDIYVRGNVDGDEWSGPLTVSTIQTPAPLPMESGFDDDADQWVIYKTKTVQGAPYPNYFIVGAADSCAGTGSKALFITNDSISYEYQTKDDAGEIGFSNAWATRNINIANAGTYTFKFKIKVPANKENESDYATAHLFPAGATIFAGNATMLNGTTRAGTAVTDVPAQNIYSLMGKTFHQDDWIWVTKKVEVANAGIYTLALFWYNASVGAQYGQALAVDSVTVEEYECSVSKDVEFVNRGAKEVSLKWFGGNCKNFEYVVSEYKNLGNPALIDDEDKVAYGTLSNGPQVTLSGLMPNTNYSFYVRTICEDALTDWFEFDFDTPCDLYSLPYTESFAETPNCWIFKSATVGYKNYKTPEMEKAEKWTCLTLNNGGLAILPELNVPLNKVKIEIGLFNSGFQTGAVSIGIMDNSWDVSTFYEVKPCQTMNKLSSSSSSGNPLVLEEFEKPLNLYTGSGKVLAIKNTTSEPINVKYIKLTELPDCMTPYQVEITYPEETAATVNWIAGTEEKWEIKVNGGDPFEVTEEPYRLTGLEQGTVYEVAVRAICDETHKSEWSLPATFQTKCGVYSLPMIEDFSGLEQPVGTANLRKAALTCWDNFVSTYNIDQVVKGNDAPFKPEANTYAANMWVSNWINALGTYDQLESYHNTSSPAYRYKWFISPQYAIEGEATLSFDIRRCGNQGQPVPPSSDRTFVAISTDNGATWKAADTTQLTDLTNYNSDSTLSLYTNRSISLKKYAGKTIRVAFYDENVSSPTIAENPFILIDNVRMNCSETYEYEANACQGYNYEGYGFSIPDSLIPAAGQSKRYERFAKAQGDGCDSTVVLTLTTYTTPAKDTISATICRGEVYEFGTYRLTEPSSSNPGGKPYYISRENENGCITTVYLNLFVNPSDTTDQVPVEILNSELPYKVDEYYTIPKNAPIGPDTIVVKTQGCSFNRYFINVIQCVKITQLEDEICSSVANYEANGFTIPSEKFGQLPEAGSFIEYQDSIRTEAGCDSLVTLKLFVRPNDTVKVAPVVTENNLLPYIVDEDYTVPEKTPVSEFDTLIYLGSCTYKLYHVTVNQCIRTANFEAEICETQASYNGYGFVIPSDEFGQLPAKNSFKLYEKHVLTAEECDSIITLKLTVHKADTILVEETVLNNELPYMAGEVEIVAKDAVLGEQPAVVLSSGDCQFTKYIITVDQCKKMSEIFNDTICELADNYEGHGFSIANDELPAANITKKFERHELTAEGCDSLITLMLTVKNDTTKIPVQVLITNLPYQVDEYYTVPADAPVDEEFIVTKQIGDEGCSYNRYIVMVSACGAQETYSASICQNTDSYEGYGFTIAANEYPVPGQTKQFYRNQPADEGCILVTLNLTVNKADTALFTDEILNNELPYKVDDQVIVAAGAALGEQPAVVLETGDCQYTKYIITVNQCQAESKSLEATVCETADGYYDYGFEIAKADMPAANAFDYFTRHETTAAGCDSLITLKLTVHKADTFVITDEILNNELPYMVGDVEIIAAGAELGEQPAVLIESGDCQFTKYIITVNQCQAEPMSLEASVCETAEGYYENGFAIAKADMPAADSTMIFTRHETTLEGCDSLITLKLTVIKADTAIVVDTLLNTELPFMVGDEVIVAKDAAIGTQSPVTIQSGECSFTTYEITVAQCELPVWYEDEICSDQVSYVGYGFSLNQAELPAPGKSKEYTRNAMNEAGCDSVITFTLSVVQIDTLDIKVTVDNTQLPYEVDNFYTVPADATIGESYEVVLKSGDCSYNRYLITVNQCTRNFRYAETLCEDQKSFEGYGFTIAEADMPAVGENKSFERQNTSEAGCDSIITLTLFVQAFDTIDKPVEVLNTRLPYTVDEYYTVPADAPVGETFVEVRKAGDNGCTYYKYIVTVSLCKDEYNFVDIACPDEAYAGFGFTVAATDLPAIGESKSYERSAISEEGCDSIITLTLTVKPTVITDDTVTIENTQLPYEVDAYYTVPADAPVGETFEVIIKTSDDDCVYNKYIVTVSQCQQSYEFEDAICDGQAPYQGYGFVIEAAQMPAVGDSATFSRNAKDEVGCDSIITLTLTVWKNDTIDHLPAYEIKLSELPFIVDGIELLPADTEIGEYSITFPSETDECSYDRYFYNVVSDEDGLFDINSDIRNIVIYDILGHRVTTVAQASEINTLDLPQGVYMIHTMTQSGEAFCGKYIAK